MITIKFCPFNTIENGELCLITVFEEENITPYLSLFPQLDQEKIQTQLRREKFEGKANQLVEIMSDPFPYFKLWIVGLGSSKDPNSMRERGGEIVKRILNSPFQSISLIEREEVFELGLGMLLRSCTFSHKTDSKPISKEISILTHNDPVVMEHAFKASRYLYEGIKLGRELTFEPANILYPDAFTQRCKDLTQFGVKVKILDEKDLANLGMEALLSVGKGSFHPPRLVVLEWNGAKEQHPIALVGKGICYDCGGINLKRSYLMEMKWDKAGGAAVAGTLLTLALQKAPIHVVGIVGLAENLINGACLKPGDIIKTFSGKTVEIADTDNEGRLVLADCLAYVQKYFAPSAIIDLATLTPETFATLGNEYAGLYCNHPSLRSSLLEAGEASGEKLWPLPMGSAYAKQIFSEMADIKNSGTPFFGEGAAAAEFLKCFIHPTIPWAHLDIAGVAWLQEDDHPLAPKGVTGYGVRLLIEWLQRSSIA